MPETNRADFDADAAKTALLRLVATGAVPGGDAGEQARVILLAWLLVLPAGSERMGARAARPDLCILLPDRIVAALLPLIDGVLDIPPAPPRRTRAAPHRLH